MVFDQGVDGFQADIVDTGKKIVDNFAADWNVALDEDLPASVEKLRTLGVVRKLTMADFPDGIQGYLSACSSASNGIHPIVSDGGVRIPYMAMSSSSSMFLDRAKYPYQHSAYPSDDLGYMVALKAFNFFAASKADQVLHGCSY